MIEDKERNIYDYPYFETTYLDDDNNKHITYITDCRDIKFYQERFTVLSLELKNNNCKES